MNDELYEQWRRNKTEASPPPPPEFSEAVMRQVRQEAEARTRLRVIGDWMDRHPLARVAVIGGAMVAGIGRIAAILALLLAA